MNFNSFSLLVLGLLLLSSCGVKGNPVAPKDQNLPSVMDNYPDITVDPSLDDTVNRKR